MRITLTNEFHNRSITLSVRYERETNSAELSIGQIRRAKRWMCFAECQCSGELGYRGPGNPSFMPHIDNRTGKLTGGTLLDIR